MNQIHGCFQCSRSGGAAVKELAKRQLAPLARDRAAEVIYNSCLSFSEFKVHPWYNQEAFHGV